MADWFGIDLIPSKTKMNSINSKRKSECVSCVKSFCNNTALKRHIYTVHEGHKDHKCEKCSKCFSEVSTLRRHIYTVHGGDRDHKCDSCGKRFSEAATLKRHIHTVHQGLRDFKCNSCGKHFSDSGTMKRHVKRVHEDNKYNATLLSSSSSQNLKENINTSENETTNDNKADDQEIGKLILESPQALNKRIHPADEVGNNGHKCKLCGKLFSYSHSLKRHISSVHENTKGYECDSCGKYLSDTGNLKRHVRTVHEDNKGYECGSCGKYLSDTGTLKRHVKTVHEYNKGYECKSCRKSYARKDNLKRHKCNILFSSFLKKNINKSENETQNDYKADQAIFVQGNTKIQHAKLVLESPEALKRHIQPLVHDKNFKCDLCGKSFFHPELLGIHIKTFHENLKDWKCDSCKSLFPTAILLKEHIHTIHSCHNENCEH